MMHKTMIFGAAALMMAASASGQDAAQAPVDTSANDAVVIQSHVDAYRTGNIDAFVETFAPDATVVANGITATGKAEIRRIYALNFKPSAPKIKVVESGMSGPNVYVSVAYVFKDGRELCCSYSEYTVEDGKITYLVSIPG